MKFVDFYAKLQYGNSALTRAEKDFIRDLTVNVMTPGLHGNYKLGFEAI